MKQTLFTVGVNGNLDTTEFNPNATFRYKGRDVQEFSDTVDHGDFITTVQNYGPGAVEMMLYKDKRYAELIGIEKKYSYLMKILGKIAKGEFFLACTA